MRGPVALRNNVAVDGNGDALRLQLHLGAQVADVRSLQRNGFLVDDELHVGVWF